MARVVVTGTVVAGTPLALSGTANAAPEDVWDSLAQCESGGRWNISTGNGFAGGLQFTMSTWRANGGAGSPAAASRTQQIAVAERVLASQGWGAWPVCSRKVNARARSARAQLPVQPAVPTPRLASASGPAPAGGAVPALPAPAIAPSVPLTHRAPLMPLPAAPAAPAAPAVPAAPAPVVPAALPSAPAVPAARVPSPSAASRQALVPAPRAAVAPRPTAPRSTQRVVGRGKSLSTAARRTTSGARQAPGKDRRPAAEPRNLKRGKKLDLG